MADFLFPLETATRKKLLQLVRDRETFDRVDLDEPNTPVPTAGPVPQGTFEDNPDPFGFGFGAPSTPDFGSGFGADIQENADVAESNPFQGGFGSFVGDPSSLATRSSLEERQGFGTFPEPQEPESLSESAFTPATPAPVAPSANITLTNEQIADPDFLDGLVEKNPDARFRQEEPLTPNAGLGETKGGISPQQGLLNAALTGAEVVEGAFNVTEGALLRAVQGKNPTDIVANIEDIQALPIAAQIGIGLATGIVGGVAKAGIKTTVSLGRALIKPTVAFDSEGAATRAFRRAGITQISQGTEDRFLNSLAEGGLDVPMSSELNEFAGPILDFHKTKKSIAMQNNRVVRELLGKSGFNPGLSWTQRDIGTSLLAHQKQIVAVDQLISVAIQAAWDSHFGFRQSLPAFTKNRLLPLNRQGVWVSEAVDEAPFENVVSGFGLQFADEAPLRTTGRVSPNGLPYNKIFENPDAYVLTAEQRALIRDFNQIVNVEVERILNDVGLSLKKISLDTDNPYFVPRSITEISGIEIKFETNHALSRHHDDITDGLASGVKYGIDPRRDLELYLKWAYRKAITKQLDDDMANFAASAEDLVPLHIRKLYHQTRVNRRAVEQMYRGVKRGLAVAENSLKLHAERTRSRVRPLEQTQGDIDNLDQIIQDLDILPFQRETTPFNQFAGRSGSQIQVELDAIRTRLSSQARDLEGVLAENAPRRYRRLDETMTKEIQLQAELDSANFSGRPTIGKGQKRVPITPETLRRQLINRRGKARQATESYERLISREAAQKGTVRTAENLRQRVVERQKVLNQQLENIEEELTLARTEYRDARREYSRTKERIDASLQHVVKKEDKVALFGKNQPDVIDLFQWKEGKAGRGMFFREKDLKLLRDVLDQGQGKGVTEAAFRGLEITGNAVRALSATADFAAPFIHGLPVLATDPNAWARSTIRHYQAFFDPSVQARMVRDNLDDYQWLARNGVPIGDPEFFRLLERGGGINLNKAYKILPKGAFQDFTRANLPSIGKQTFGRFQAAYNTSLGYSRVLLLKGLRPGWKGSDNDLAAYIRNLTGGLDSRALGVGPRQRAVEGMWLAFSPRLLRSTMALIGDALRRPHTQVGRRSLQSLTQLAMGAYATYITAGFAMGKTWEEIKPGLNPLNGKRFLGHQVNNDWIGVGGQVRAAMQVVMGVGAGVYGGIGRIPGLNLPGEDSEQIQDAVNNLSSLDPYENPMIKWWHSRGATAYNIVGGFAELVGFEVLPYDEIDTVPDLMKHLFTSALPFGIQGKLEGEKPLTVAANVMLGARTIPENAYEKRDRLRKDAIVLRDDVPPGTDFDDIADTRIKKEIDETDAVKAALVEVDILRRKKNDVVQAMQDDWDSRVEVLDDMLIQSANTAEASGNMRIFRELNVPNYYRRKAIERRSVEEAHPDAVVTLQELDPPENLLNRAISEYYTRLEGALPPLEDPATGRYDFERAEKIRKEIEDGPIPDFPNGFGKVTLDEAIERSRDDDIPLIKQLRGDRELLKRYWSVPDRIVDIKKYNPYKARVWQEHLDLRGTREGTKFDKNHGNIIKEIQEDIAGIKNKIRNPITEEEKEAFGTGLTWPYDTVDALLVKWEYVQSAESPSGRVVQSRLLRRQRGFSEVQLVGDTGAR